MVGIWTGLSLLLGLMGAAGVLHSWLKKPDLSVSKVSAQFDPPPVMGGTILKQGGNPQLTPVIPAIFGSVVVEVNQGLLSESLRSCQCDITVKRGEEVVVNGIGAWEEQGQGSLEKEVDIKEGGRKQLHIFRAIIEPFKKKGYNNFEEQEASYFPILQIEEDELPLYKSEKGKVWIEIPQMVEAAFGGWIAQEDKPTKPGDYSILLELNAENINKTIEREIEFKIWLNQNRDYWQQGWRERCHLTIQKAKEVIKSIN